MERNERGVWTTEGLDDRGQSIDDGRGKGQGYFAAPMTIPDLPTDPFALVPPRDLVLTDQRTERIFGAEVELVCLPARRGRGGVPNATRPPFLPNRAPQILQQEEVWRAPGVVMTGNAFPFVERQIVLWATERRREPSIEMLQVAFAIEDATGAMSMVNSMGAAGSITRSHIHLLDYRCSFLDALPKVEIDPAEVHLDPDHLGLCQLVRIEAPFPVLAIGVQGRASERAQTLHHLLECRTSPAFNLIGADQTCWLVPRAVETPAPHFRQALGSAELSGRWCFIDEATFASTTAKDLEAAIRMAGVVPPAGSLV